MGAKVILCEPDRIQLDVKKGQWLKSSDIKDRLRTKSLDHKPCVIGSRLEGTKIQVTQIVQNSGYLENTFPRLVERYAEVAENGEVSWESFSALYDGQFAGKQAKKRVQQKPEFKSGDRVEYNSSGTWVDAKVLDYDGEQGTCMLDITPVAYPEQTSDHCDYLRRTIVSNAPMDFVRYRNIEQISDH